jgi:eukaryotic-like serine/threonine-protein kinase
MKRALDLLEKSLGQDHPDTLTSVNNLGLLYDAKGEYAAAEPLLKRALAGWEKSLGQDHPDTLTSVNNLASLFWSMHRLDESVPLFEDALRRQRITLGDDHPETLRTLANLGVNYKDAGRAAEAVPLLERAHAAARQYPQLNWVGLPLVDAYAKAGRKADAARLTAELLAADRKRLPPNSPQLGNLLASTGKALLDLDPVAAEPVLRECLELREKLAPKSWSTANAKSLLGGALLGQKKYATAEPLLLAGYAGLVADAANIPPPGRLNLPDAADRLIELYTAMDKPDEAKKWGAERAKYPFVAPPPRAAK